MILGAHMQRILQTTKVRGKVSSALGGQKFEDCFFLIEALNPEACLSCRLESRGNTLEISRKWKNAC